MTKMFTPLSAIIFCTLALVSIGLAPAASAQQAMMSPPKVLVIEREDVKPGKGAAHEKIENGYARAFAKTDLHYIGATAMAGPQAAYFLEGFESFAQWEKTEQSLGKNPAIKAELDQLSEKDGEVISGLHTMAGFLRDDLSYSPGALPVKGVRYFVVSSQRVRPGFADQFTALRKRVAAAHEKAGLSDHFAVFQMIFGVPSGTYLTFVPLQSLSEIDQYAQIHGKAYEDALGEEGQKMEREFNEKGLMGGEIMILELSPKMSNASKDWIVAEPEFWAPKPSMPMKGMTMKKEAQPVAPKQ